MYTYIAIQLMAFSYLCLRLEHARPCRACKILVVIRYSVIDFLYTHHMASQTSTRPKYRTKRSREQDTRHEKNLRSEPETCERTFFLVQAPENMHNQHTERENIVSGIFVYVFP